MTELASSSARTFSPSTDYTLLIFCKRWSLSTGESGHLGVFSVQILKWFFSFEPHVHASCFSCVWLTIPWTVVRQASLLMEFFRQEYWSGLPFPFPGDLPDLTQKLNPCLLCLLHWQVFFTTSTTWEETNFSSIRIWCHYFQNTWIGDLWKEMIGFLTVFTVDLGFSFLDIM